MGVVRLEAMRGLQNAIVTAAPKLEGHIFVGQAPPDKKACFPALVIDPVRFRYFPDQADEHFDSGADRVVLRVGRHEGTIQLRLGAATFGERCELEQKLLDLFLSQEMRPGVLLTEITACPDLGDFVAAWEFEDDQWSDERAFDKEYWSIMTVTAQIPALVARGGVYRIEDLRLGITDDFVTAYTSSTFDTSSKVKRVRINENGTLTPL